MMLTESDQQRIDERIAMRSPAPNKTGGRGEPPARTLHELVVAKLIIDGCQAFGFRKGLAKWARAFGALGYEDDDSEKAALGLVHGFIPDAWRVDGDVPPEPGVITIYEVVDTNDLSIDKLDAYSALYAWADDDTQGCVRLIRVDRLGVEAEISLEDHQHRQHCYWKLYEAEGQRVARIQPDAYSGRMKGWDG